MLTIVTRFLAAALILLPAFAIAEPIRLKLAYFSSDRTHLYRSLVKPFVDAVNAEGKGRVEIEVYLSGKLSRDVTRQSQLLRDGTADIAYVVQSYERSLFPDSSVIELPGLFQNGREATLVFTGLVERGAMRGFSEFFVIGAVASEPESIHTRTPIATIEGLKGKRIRANNDAETAVLKKLGATPVFVPLNETAEAISADKIDGAYVPPVPMIEFGIGRVAPYHYFLRTSCVPLSLLMSRKKFDSLPLDVQAIIRKYSGEWLAQQSIQINEVSTDLVMVQLESDPKRHVVFPSPADLTTARAVFTSVIDDYVTGDPHRAALVKAARSEIARFRLTE